MQPTFGGLDPGTSGAAAIVGDGWVAVYDVPTVRVKVGKRKNLQKRLDEPAFSTLARAIIDVADPVSVTVEALHGVGQWKRTDEDEARKQSSTSQAVLHETLGAQRMAFVAAGARIERVAPAKWKRAFGLIGQDKTASRILAARLWPQSAALFARVKDDGRAEAALIAEFGRRVALQLPFPCLPGISDAEAERLIGNRPKVARRRKAGGDPFASLGRVEAAEHLDIFG